MGFRNRDLYRLPSCFYHYSCSLDDIEKLFEKPLCAGSLRRYQTMYYRHHCSHRSSYDMDKYVCKWLESFRKLAIPSHYCTDFSSNVYLSKNQEKSVISNPIDSGCGMSGNHNLRSVNPFRKSTLFEISTITKGPANAEPFQICRYGNFTPLSNSGLK